MPEWRSRSPVRTPTEAWASPRAPVEMAGVRSSAIRESKTIAQSTSSGASRSQSSTERLPTSSSLHQEAHVDRELAGLGQLAGHVEKQQEVALVIGRPACVKAPVALRRLEGWRQRTPLPARGPARRSGRRRAPSAPSAGQRPPARPRPSDGRRRGVTVSALPPAASIRSRRRRPARARRRHRRPWTPRECAASRPALRGSWAWPGIVPCTYHRHDAALVLAGGGGGAGGHHVLRRGVAAPPRVRRPVRPVQDRRRDPHCGLSRGHVRSRGAERLARRPLGVKPTLLLGLCLLGVTSLVFAFAHTIVLLDAARFVQGVGGACMWAAGMAWLVSASPPERRGELIGSALAAAIVGVLLGPVLGGRPPWSAPRWCSARWRPGRPCWPWAWSMPGVARAGRHTRPAAACARAPRGAGRLLAVHPPRDLRGVIEVLGPLRLDDFGASGAAIGAVFLLTAGGGRAQPGRRARVGRRPPRADPRRLARGRGGGRSAAASRHGGAARAGHHAGLRRPRWLLGPGHGDAVRRLRTRDSIRHSRSRSRTWPGRSAMS